MNQLYCTFPPHIQRCFIYFVWWNKFAESIQSCIIFLITDLIYDHQPILIACCNKTWSSQISLLSCQSLWCYDLLIEFILALYWKRGITKYDNNHTISQYYTDSWFSFWLFSQTISELYLFQNNAVLILIYVDYLILRGSNQRGIDNLNINYPRLSKWKI